MLEKYSIQLEERAKFYSACVRLALLYAAETWAVMEILEGLLACCDHRMLRYMSREDGRTGLLTASLAQACLLQQ